MVGGRRRSLCLLGLLSLALVKSALYLARRHNHHNTNVTQEALRTLLADGERENSDRLRRVQEVCQRYNLGSYRRSGTTPRFKYPPTPQYSVFYFNRGDGVAFCPVYKAASSTWLYNLSKLGGETDDVLSSGKEQLSSVARRHFPELDGAQAHQALLNSSRLLSVRHPFDRILSAYRDKLENRNRDPSSGTLHYYRRWGSRVRAKFRQAGNPEPTFQEFVRYLIQTDLLNYADDHWIPYNPYCTPCLVRYDFIAKVESLSRDQLFFIHSLGLSERITAVRRHQSAGRNLTVEYFSQLTRAQVEALYHKYKLDFEMFNYSPQKYILMAKP